jgi:3-dehydroquinate synthase
VDEILIGDRSRIVVGRRVLSAGVLLGERERMPAVVAIFTQPGASAIAGELAADVVAGGVRAEVRVLPDGEAAKDLAVAAHGYRWLAELGLGRWDVVVGVGGGSVTDLAGFVAATWMRGVEAIHVPTTLLGAVDAAVGGKTGVDLDGKNLVGAFHHPSRVIVDVEVLEGLPADLRREGLAEALKCGLIADRGLLELLEQRGEEADLAEVVRRAVAVKAAVVERDFREAGERAILNYGHTIGHAVEVAAGLRHGPAVAIGMVAAGRASALVLGFAEEARQRAAITGLGLPVAAPPTDAALVRRLVTLDKKRAGGEVRMVLLAGIADPRLLSVGAATVDAALAAIDIA